MSGCCVVLLLAWVVGVVVGFNRPNEGYEVPVVQEDEDDYEMQAVPQPQASRTKKGTKTKTKSNAKAKKNGRADFSAGGSHQPALPKHSVHGSNDTRGGVNHADSSHDYVNMAKVMHDSASAHSAAADHDYINLPNMQGCDGEDDYEIPTVQQTSSGASASAHSAAADHDYINVPSPASAVVPGVPTSTKTRSKPGKGKDRKAGRNKQSTIMTRPSAKGAKGKVAALLNRFSNPEPSGHTGRRSGSISLKGFDTSDTNL